MRQKEFVCNSTPIEVLQSCPKCMVTRYRRLRSMQCLCSPVLATCLLLMDSSRCSCSLSWIFAHEMRMAINTTGLLRDQYRSITETAYTASPFSFLVLIVERNNAIRHRQISSSTCTWTDLVTGNTWPSPWLAAQPIIRAKT